MAFRQRLRAVGISVLPMYISRLTALCIANELMTRLAGLQEKELLFEQRLWDCEARLTRALANHRALAAQHESLIIEKHALLRARSDRERHLRTCVAHLASLLSLVPVPHRADLAHIFGPGQVYHDCLHINIIDTIIYTPEP